MTALNASADVLDHRLAGNSCAGVFSFVDVLQLTQVCDVYVQVPSFVVFFLFDHQMNVKLHSSSSSMPAVLELVFGDTSLYGL